LLLYICGENYLNKSFISEDLPLNIISESSNDHLHLLHLHGTISAIWQEISTHKYDS